MIASVFNISAIIFLRFFVEDGYTKDFLKSISFFLMFLVFLFLPLFIPKITIIKKKIYDNKTTLLQTAFISAIIPIYLLLNNWSSLFFGKVVYFFSLFMLLFQIFLFSFFFRSINEYANNKKDQLFKEFTLKSFLDLNYLVLVLITLFQYRFSLGNSQF